MAEKEVKIKFFNAKEKLPSRSGNYLCIADSGYVTKMEYSAKHKKFNCCDHQERSLVEAVSIPVIWWASLKDLKTLGVRTL